MQNRHYSQLPQQRCVGCSAVAHAGPSRRGRVAADFNKQLKRAQHQRMRLCADGRSAAAAVERDNADGRTSSDVHAPSKHLRSIRLRHVRHCRHG